MSQPSLPLLSACAAAAVLFQAGCDLQTALQRRAGRWAAGCGVGGGRWGELPGALEQQVESSSLRCDRPARRIHCPSKLELEQRTGEGRPGGNYYSS